MENKESLIKEVFNDFNKDNFCKKNTNSIDIVNNDNIPISEIKGINPFLYKFKNKLIDIVKIDNIDINSLLQLHMMVLANTTKESKLILFRLPTPNDKEFSQQITSDIIKSIGSVKGGILRILASERLVAFYNGIPIEITRDFMISIMGLNKNQTISDYLNKIGCKYEIRAGYQLNQTYFEELASSMQPYLIEGDRINEVVKVLKSNKKYILYIDDKCTVRLYFDNRFKLEVNLNTPDISSSNKNLGGLLSNVTIMRVLNYDIILDVVTANTLLAYFLDDDEDINKEGINFLANILNTYPTTKEVE